MELNPLLAVAKSYAMYYVLLIQLPCRFTAAVNIVVINRKSVLLKTRTLPTTTQPPQNRVSQLIYTVNLLTVFNPWTPKMTKNINHTDKEIIRPTGQSREQLNSIAIFIHIYFVCGDTLESPAYIARVLLYLSSTASQSHSTGLLKFRSRLSTSDVHRRQDHGRRWQEQKKKMEQHDRRRNQKMMANLSVHMAKGFS